ncbi:pyridoxal-phosphate dependent enzyme [candidate division KSB1 bacterium]|nr:pyridoxal-phosphate dependent enzyme [candidate division KSB1 bacterium]NIR71612.1 pyridoxal-phosphate dependent enzyme [candidate division KSB1 bacterium]NIS23447.1 pyridoxal-phosphate dependent enzyme [candidate division KSB1 bacterium]NIT70355.1 pyridoxal-phosphate dependent enzyme [candidate division KSB1 bacterium]NIU24057.1 pyridoxal-phosphate dependent enzyme [candidate division KSB1 bacterium]
MSSIGTISVKDINFARDQIKRHIYLTPLEPSPQLSHEFSAEIHFKLENWQRTGSFKLRGALNKMLSLSEEERNVGVVTASVGNHGLGVAYAAKLFGIPGKIVVPEKASPAKVKALKSYDLQLIEHGRDYDEAEEHARELEKADGLIFVHAFSDPPIIAGQGTVGLEIMEALPDVHTIVVPVGGGGLVCGVAIAVKSMNPAVNVIGVQSEASPAMVNSIRAGKVVETPIEETVADGLAGRFVTELTLKMVQDYVDDVVLVSEDAIKKAMKMIVESEHMLVEASAAVGVAAFLEQKIGATPKCAIILTGRNVDVTVLKRIL